MRKQATDWFELMKPWKPLFLEAGEAAKILPKTKLFKDPDWNFAAWNSLGIASWLVPAIVTTALGSNLSWRNKIKNRRADLEKSKLSGNRAILSPNQDLDYTDNITDIPKKELDMITQRVGSLGKKANDPYEPSWLVSGNGTLAKAAPIALTPIAAWLLSKFVNKQFGEAYKQELQKERVQLQNLQDAVDAKTLEERGLILPTMPATMPKKASGGLSDKLSSWFSKLLESDAMKKTRDAAKTAADQTNNYLFKIPPALMLTIAALGTFGGGMYLSGRDENKKKLELLSKKMLGENRLADTAAIDLDLAPGNYITPKKQQMLQIIPGLSNRIEEAQVIPNTEAPKKDALFM